MIRQQNNFIRIVLLFTFKPLKNNYKLINTNQIKILKFINFIYSFLNYKWEEDLAMKIKLMKSIKMKPNKYLKIIIKMIKKIRHRNNHH